MGFSSTNFFHCTESINVYHPQCPCKEFLLLFSYAVIKHFFVCLHWNHNPQLMLHILALIKIKKNHFLSSSPPGHSWLHRTILPVHFLQADPSCLKLPTCKELILYLWQSEPLNPFLNLCKIGLRDGRSAHGSWMQMHHRPRQLPIFFCSVLS